MSGAFRSAGARWRESQFPASTPEIEMALSASDPRCPFPIQDEGRTVYDFETAWATARVGWHTRNTIPRSSQTALTNVIEAGLSEKEANGNQRARDARGL